MPSEFLENYEEHELVAVAALFTRIFFVVLHVVLLVLVVELVEVLVSLVVEDVENLQDAGEVDAHKKPAIQAGVVPVGEEDQASKNSLTLAQHSGAAPRHAIPC